MADLLKQNYEIDLASGKVTANGHEDHAQALAMVKALQEGGGFEKMLSRHIPQQAAAEGSSSDSALNIDLAQAQGNWPKPNNVGLKLADALQLHLVEEARHLKSERTVNEKISLYKEFADFFGDIYLNQITQPDITDRWRISEFARENEKYPGEKLSLSRLEKRRGYLSKFFKWVKGSGKYAHDTNPVSQQMASKKQIKARTRHYKEFTTEDLSALFHSGYREYMNKSDWYWAPLMSLYSGARKGEVANLQLDAFEVIDGIDIYFIPDAKTPDGKRTVPIHSMLLKLGLMDYVRFLRTKGETHLFGLRPAKTRDKSVGREWGIWVDRCGIKDKTKTFHSFRPTVITDMHYSATPNVAAIRDSVGHSGGTSGVHGGYIRGAQLKRLQETIETLQYPSVKFEEMKLDDPTFSHWYEVEKARISSPEYRASTEKRKRQAALRPLRLAKIEQRKKSQVNIKL